MWDPPAEELQGQGMVLTMMIPVIQERGVLDLILRCLLVQDFH